MASRLRFPHWQAYLRPLQQLKPIMIARLLCFTLFVQALIEAQAQVPAGIDLKVTD